MDKLVRIAINDLCDQRPAINSEDLFHHVVKKFDQPSLCSIVFKFRTKS